VILDSASSHSPHNTGGRQVSLASRYSALQTLSVVGLVFGASHHLWHPQPPTFLGLAPQQLARTVFCSRFLIISTLATFGIAMAPCDRGHSRRVCAAVAFGLILDLVKIPSLLDSAFPKTSQASSTKAHLRKKGQGIGMTIAFLQTPTFYIRAFARASLSCCLIIKLVIRSGPPKHLPSHYRCSSARVM